MAKMNEDFPCFDRLDGRERDGRRDQNCAKLLVPLQVKCRSKRHFVVLLREKTISLKKP